MTGSRVHVDCAGCRGCGYLWPPPDGESWKLCSACDGTGRTWIPGAPAFGCQFTLADRCIGEIVTLGNGDRGRIVWQSKPKVTPAMTAIRLMDDFTDEESRNRTLYPSNVGVSSVAAARFFVDNHDHANQREIDSNDPMQRGRL